MDQWITSPASRNPDHASPTGWLTAVLRPAGTLDGAAADALLRLLADLSTTADMVVVDLAAARIRHLPAFAGRCCQPTRSPPPWRSGNRSGPGGIPR